MSVAIVVPNLNQGRFLGAALDSLRANVSVVRAVLDGGSTDGSRDLIAERASELAYWRSEADEGQAAAINEGISRLCSLHPDAVDVVGWLNADDFFLENGLDQLWQALVQHPDWVAVSGRGALASESGALVGEVATAPFSPERFARACTICQPATLIRRWAWERIGGLDASLHMCFDYDLWWRLHGLGPIGHLDAMVAASRDHGETKTRRHRIQYFREATAIVKRETGTVRWHWYISEALERQVGYEVGRRPPLIDRREGTVCGASRLRAGQLALVCPLMAHIVHICPRYFPAWGGVELFFTKLSEALSRGGHTVSVWTTDAATVRGFTSPLERRLPSGPDQINGVDVVRFPVRHVPAQRYVRTAAHWLPFGMRWKCDTLRWTPWVPALTRAATKQSRGVDIVHAAGLPYSSVLYAGVTLAERTGARLIISPFTHVAPSGPAGAHMRRAYLSPLNLRLLSRAHRVFAQTELERRTLGEAGVPIDRQTSRGSQAWIPPKAPGGTASGLDEAGAVADDSVVVGHLANKSWDKGTVDLLDAAERLWDKGLSFSLVLAGSEMPSFARRWANARFCDRIVNMSELSDAGRRDFFAAIDVFALPSYVESFGISSLEAALTGAAIVAYDHGGPAQIFRHGVDALLAPVGDVEILARSLEALVTDPASRTRLSEAGGKLASGYSWTRALDVALADYDLLLRPHEAGRDPKP